MASAIDDAIAARTPTFKPSSLYTHTDDVLPETSSTARTSVVAESPDAMFERRMALIPDDDFRVEGWRARAEEVPNSAKPQYTYDARVGRYRDADTGQFVAARNLPWPDNAGFASSTMQPVMPGKILDRFGDLDGRFMGEPGASIAERGMAQGAEGMAYRQLQVIKQFDARVGPAAAVPEFNATGGATQYLQGRTVQQLIDDGFLAEIKP